MDEDSYTDIWAAIAALRKADEDHRITIAALNETIKSMSFKHDEDMQDLRLTLDVALKTNKALGLRIDALSTRIDDLNRSVNNLEGIKEE